jgi:hypothetical protein
MADQRSRGGKKAGTQTPRNPEQHQRTEVTRSQPEKEKQPTDRPRPSNPQQDQVERGQ